MPKTIKLPKENEAKASWLWNWQWFLGYNSKTVSTKANIDTLDYITLKKFCVSKDTTEEEASCGMGEIFLSHTFLI